MELSLKNFQVADEIQYIICIAAGPSLDVAIEEILKFNNRETLFLVSDVVSDQFIRRYHPEHILVFSVENRYHNYLKRFRGSHLAFYLKANFRNIPRKNKKLTVYSFGLKGEKEINHFQLASPGTVGGIIFSYGLFLAATGKIRKVILFGYDLSFPDNRYLSRFSFSQFEHHNRFQTRETVDFSIVLRKTSGVISEKGQIIRTSFEFIQTRKNMYHLLKSIEKEKKQAGDAIIVEEYSPIPFGEDLTHKNFPENWQKYL